MELYHDQILGLNRNPLNKKSLANFDLRATGNNPICGDKIEMFIKLNNDLVTNVGWQGEGCAISQAGVSLLAESIKNKSKKDLDKITNKEVLQMLGLEKINATRMRCALLGLETLKQALLS